MTGVGEVVQRCCSSDFETSQRIRRCCADWVGQTLMAVEDSAFEEPSFVSVVWWGKERKWKKRGEGERGRQKRGFGGKESKRGRRTKERRKRGRRTRERKKEGEKRKRRKGGRRKRRRRKRKTEFDPYRCKGLAGTVNKGRSWTGRGSIEAAEQRSSSGGGREGMQWQGQRTARRTQTARRRQGGDSGDRQRRQQGKQVRE